MPDIESATTSEQARRVREMFASIAARYDLLNHLLSGNIDRRWRNLVAELLEGVLANRDARVLDVACGTGDLSITLGKNGQARILGVDFCRPMLDIAADKARKVGFAIPFVEGDALKLPFTESSFDAVTIAFGLRNLASVNDGFKELFRVLKPGGQLAVLEFSKPRARLLRLVFGIYFTKFLPFVGGLISGSRRAYQYLPDSVSRFPDQDELSHLMREAGFADVTFRNLTGGIAALHLGKRPY